MRDGCPGMVEKGEKKNEKLHHEQVFIHEKYVQVDFKRPAATVELSSGLIAIIDDCRSGHAQQAVIRIRKFKFSPGSGLAEGKKQDLDLLMLIHGGGDRDIYCAF